MATDTDPFVIGDIVYVNGDATKRGKICCIGEVEFAKGDFAGVVLDLPIGNFLYIDIDFNLGGSFIH